MKKNIQSKKKNKIKLFEHLSYKELKSLRRYLEKLEEAKYKLEGEIQKIKRKLKRINRAIKVLKTQYKI